MEKMGRSPGGEQHYMCLWLTDQRNSCFTCVLNSLRCVWLISDQCNSCFTCELNSLHCVADLGSVRQLLHMRAQLPALINLRAVVSNQREYEQTDPRGQNSSLKQSANQHTVHFRLHNASADEHYRRSASVTAGSILGCYGNLGAAGGVGAGLRPGGGYPYGGYGGVGGYFPAAAGLKPQKSGTDTRELEQEDFLVEQEQGPEQGRDQEVLEEPLCQQGGLVGEVCFREWPLEEDSSKKQELEQVDFLVDQEQVMGALEVELAFLEVQQVVYLEQVEYQELSLVLIQDIQGELKL
ncbi:hypothetical protein JZ751_010309 [Albula glossodonta]|uniref:Uncharacterized protein n=1 Tax=Albula glossodonta TaxID=121402 RepID=A0A8T2MWK6_9TELE|nr:hypothetical protein JZ751_010309 [Albula glossodonta]